MRKILLGMAALVAMTGGGCAIRGPAETVKTPPNEGLRDHPPFEAIVVYEVDEGLIRNVWMFYPE